MGMVVGAISAIRSSAAAISDVFAGSWFRDKSSECESKAALVRQEKNAELADRQFQQKREELNLEQKKLSLARDKCKADWAITERSAVQEEQNYRQRQQALTAQLEQAKLETERVELKKSRLALEEAWIAVQAEIRKNKIALHKAESGTQKAGVFAAKARV